MAKLATTRADLCNAVCQRVGLPRGASAALVELVLKEITDCLARGETVQLSSFGCSSCARRASASAAIRKPARSCRSRRAGLLCSSRPQSSSGTSIPRFTAQYLPGLSLGVAPMPAPPDFMSPVERAAARQRSAAKSRAVKTA
jgi:nucleoid DNA-binding protein